jgi:hypothetical protein
MSIRIWDRSVGIVTGSGLGGLGSIPGRGKTLYLLHNVPTGYEATQPPVQWVEGALSPGVKTAGA